MAEQPNSPDLSKLPRSTRPPYQPTEADRRMVELMVAAGIPQDTICRCLDISYKTLAKHYRKELDTAVGRANAKVAGTLYATATNPAHPGHVRAAEFWLKTRARWRTEDKVVVAGDAENPLRHEHSIDPALFDDLSADEARLLLAIGMRARRRAQEGEGGPGDD